LWENLSFDFTNRRRVSSDFRGRTFLEEELVQRALKRGPASREHVAVFESVEKAALTLPNVEATTKYDGSPVLRVGGCFMAGLATRGAAEPATLVVRVGFEERECLLEDASDIYYLTDYYRRYPVVLVRLSRVDRDALRDLLSVSRRLALVKTRKRGRTAEHGQITMTPFL
jgi:hypothetical protein